MPSPHLDSDDASLFLLRHVEGLSIEELAGMFQMEKNNVAVRLHRIRHAAAGRDGAVGSGVRSGFRTARTTRISWNQTMKKLIAFALVLAALAPAVAAQTSASFAGKWEGTFKMQRPDGTEGDPRPVGVRPDAEGHGAHRHRRPA